jgi:hypothetical protein
MAVVIVATVGGSTSNSYVTLAEAESYMEARLNAALWDAASDDTKNRALVESTRELDVLDWDGWRTDDVQALSWPREWVVDPDDPNGDYFASNVIPQRVKDACMELANQFVKAGTTDVAALDDTTGIRRKKVDVLETEYEPGYRKAGMARYPRVMAFIRPLLKSVVGSLMVRVVRG